MHGRFPRTRPGEPTGSPVPREAEEAVRTLVRWAGDVPDREGLSRRGYGDEPHARGVSRESGTRTEFLAAVGGLQCLAL